MVSNKWRAISIFVVMTMLVISFVVYVLPSVFRKFYDPANWTIGKYLTIPLCIVVIISPLAAIATYVISISENIEIVVSPFQQVTIWYIRASFVSIFPTLIFYFLNKGMAPDPVSYNMAGRRYTDNNTSQETFAISGSNKESLELLPDDFLYAEVLGNYVTIYYLHDNELRQKAMRTTLQQIIEEMEAYPQFIRCHRSFIVNISNITDVRGNSHAYKLNLKNLEGDVPVSKSYTRLIKEKLDL